MSLPLKGLTVAPQGRGSDGRMKERGNQEPEFAPQSSLKELPSTTRSPYHANPGLTLVSPKRAVKKKARPKVERPREPVVQDRPADKETAKHPRAKQTPEQRQEYERARNQTPERREYNRSYAQEQRRIAKEANKCRDCSKPAIPGKTRCEACAESHRQSRRTSDAKRRATVEATKTPGKALAQGITK